jgi:toxin ParE1/3/4
VRIIWSRGAGRDLDLIAEYISRDNPAAAFRTISAIIRQVDMLGEFPALGRVGRLTGTRELVVSRLPYIVVYSHAQDAVRIVRVLHGATNWTRRS